jgi:hypothetical protein
MLPGQHDKDQRKAPAILRFDYHQVAGAVTPRRFCGVQCGFVPSSDHQPKVAVFGHFHVGWCQEDVLPYSEI